jgi:glycosyltransferase involved in cell wall biosynthesis
MRILVLTDQVYPDATGGVGKSLYNECAAMARHGHDVTVLVRCLNHSLPAEETIDGFRVVRLYGPKSTSPFYYLYPFAILILAIRWLRKTIIPFDLLYSLNPLFTLAGVLSGASRKAPMTFSFFAFMASEIEISLEHGKYGWLTPFAGIAAWILQPLEKLAMSKVTAALPRSEYSAGMLRRICPSVFVPEPLIPLGVDTQLFKPQDNREVRSRLDLPLDRSILICVRRLDYRMGLQNLVSAMVQVKKEHPDTLLLIAGKGPIRTSLEEQILELELQDHVRLLGFVSESDLPLYLSAADLFVLPTEFLEGFGLATLEALSSGCPVIGTPVGATPELLDPIEPLLITHDASPEALAERLTYWLDHRGRLSELREKCRREVEEHYDIEIVAHLLEERFRGLFRV